MLRKLRAIWKIITCDQYKVYTYKSHGYDPNDEYMHADYASYTFSDKTDKVDSYIDDVKRYVINDIKDYNLFYRLNSKFEAIIYDYFNKHISKGNDDIEYRDAWFKPNEITISYYNIETELGWSHTISIEKFINFYNTEYDEGE